MSQAHLAGEKKGRQGATYSEINKISDSRYGKKVMCLSEIGSYSLAMCYLLKAIATAKNENLINYSDFLSYTSNHDRPTSQRLKLASGNLSLAASVVEYSWLTETLKPLLRLVLGLAQEVGIRAFRLSLCLFRSITNFTTLCA